MVTNREEMNRNSTIINEIMNSYRTKHFNYWLPEKFLRLCYLPDRCWQNRHMSFVRLITSLFDRITQSTRCEANRMVLRNPSCFIPKFGLGCSQLLPLVRSSVLFRLCLFIFFFSLLFPTTPTSLRFYLLIHSAARPWMQQ